MNAMLRRFWKDESGQSLTEYGMLAAALVVIVVAAMAIFRTQLEEFFASFGERLNPPTE